MIYVRHPLAAIVAHFFLFASSIILFRFLYVFSWRHIFFNFSSAFFSLCLDSSVDWNGHNKFFFFSRIYEVAILPLSVLYSEWSFIFRGNRICFSLKFELNFFEWFVIYILLKNAYRMRKLFFEWKKLNFDFRNWVNVKRPCGRCRYSSAPRTKEQYIECSMLSWKFYLRILIFILLPLLLFLSIFFFSQRFGSGWIVKYVFLRNIFFASSRDCFEENDKNMWQTTFFFTFFSEFTKQGQLMIFHLFEPICYDSKSI